MPTKTGMCISRETDADNTVIAGGPADDTIFAGKGLHQTLTGAGGADVFVFANSGPWIDADHQLRRGRVGRGHIREVPLGRDEGIGLHVRRAGVAADDIGQRGRGDHLAGPRIEALVLPEEAVAGLQIIELPR